MPQNPLLVFLRPAVHEFGNYKTHTSESARRFLFLNLPVDLEFGFSGVSKRQEHGYSDKNPKMYS